MKLFFKQYFFVTKNLFKNFWFYFFVLMILSGGHTVKGKAVAIALTIIIFPLLAMWRAKLELKPRKKVESEKLKNEDAQ